MRPLRAEMRNQRQMVDQRRGLMARTMPAARSRDATAAGAEADAEADEETPEGDVALVRRVRVALACRLHKIGIEREPAKAKS